MIGERSEVDPAVDMRVCEVSDSEIRKNIVEAVVQEYRGWKDKKMLKNLPREIKNNLSSKHGPIWNVVVGSSFGLDVTYMAGFFMFFYVEETAFAVYKTSG
ncbi:MAG: Dynein light chain [Amphiamblys sp. WSBS2006]|nr:MAG: Dynein light chain [Amphiamblys sp. WSBS2006]